MNVVNFTQLLSHEASSGVPVHITGIFDTVLAQPTPRAIFVCVSFSQIAKETILPYYYRIILRPVQVDNLQWRHRRIASGILWDQADKDTVRTLVPQHSGMLQIKFEAALQHSGDYEVELYVKPMAQNESQTDCDAMSAKELQLMAVTPLKVLQRH